MSWWCYIVQCADDTLYTGITNDLEKRLTAHNAGSASKYTRVRLPVTLRYSEVCENRSGASKREAHIKKMTRNKKLMLIAATKKQMRHKAP